MDVTSILLILTVLLLTAAFVVRPFFEKKSRSHLLEMREGTELAKLEHTRSSLLAEKERALNSIQELDFDHSLHKIPEELYPEQRVTLMQQAAGILKQLEDMGFEQKSAPPVRIPSETQEGYDELEELIAKRRGEMKEKNTGFCPRCGKAVKEGDRFCPKCGATIDAVRSEVKGKK